MNHIAKLLSRRVISIYIPTNHVGDIHLSAHFIIKKNFSIERQMYLIITLIFPVFYSEVKHILYIPWPFVFCELYFHVLCSLSVGLIIPIFFGQRIWGLESLNNLPTITQLARGRAIIQTSLTPSLEPLHYTVSLALEQESANCYSAWQLFLQIELL